jgi:hypothetical protein
MSEHAYVHNLTHEMDIMRSLIKGTAVAPEIHQDLAVIHPHADPLSFYFSVRAADSNLLEEVNLLGAGHHGLFTADHIYSDVSFLQSQYDYWLV